MVGDPLDVKRTIGYVPESGALFEALTGWEYLRLVAALYLIPSEAAHRIERFGNFFDLTTATLPAQQLGAYSKECGKKSSLPRRSCTTRRSYFSMNRLTGWTPMRLSV